MNPRKALTAEQVLVLHEECITANDITVERNRQLRVYGEVHIPKNLNPVCLAPSHKFCSHNLPTQEQLDQINTQLGNSLSNAPPKPKEIEEGQLLKPGPTRIKGKLAPWWSEEQGRPDSKWYFCLLCKDWHNKQSAMGISHIEHKREAGNPRGWPQAARDARKNPGGKGKKRGPYKNKGMKRGPRKK